MPWVWWLIMSQQSIEQATQTACLSVNIEYKDVAYDGRFHATNIIDDPRGRNDGRIKIFPDREGGIVWNHKSGERKSFFINQKSSGSMTDEERAKIKAEQERRKKERKAKQNKAANQARAIWSKATPAPKNHPYLVKKHIKPHLTRVSSWTKNAFINDKWQKIIIENALLIPLFNEAGTIRNVQAIFPDKHPDLDRNKDFLASAELSGLFSWIGDKSDTVLIAEGLATASTLHQETGNRVYIAFTANNLLAVAKTVRKHRPTASIVLCADNDKTKNNPGVTKATEAASAVNGLISIPPICGMDFNDYAAYLRGQHDG